MWRGVWPSALGTLRSAPLSRRSWASSRWPQLHAMWKGVDAYCGGGAAAAGHVGADGGRDTHGCNGCERGRLRRAVAKGDRAQERERPGAATPEAKAKGDRARAQGQEHEPRPPHRVVSRMDVGALVDEPRGHGGVAVARRLEELERRLVLGGLLLLQLLRRRRAGQRERERALARSNDDAMRRRAHMIAAPLAGAGRSKKARRRSAERDEARGSSRYAAAALLVEAHLLARLRVGDLVVLAGHGGGGTHTGAD